MTRITVNLSDIDKGHIDIEPADGDEYLTITSDYRQPLEGKLDPGALPALSSDESRALAAVLVAQADAIDRRR
jgi:hypothetical protein